MYEALRIKTPFRTYILNANLIDFLVFDDKSKVMRIGITTGNRNKTFSFPYEDLLELNDLQQAYCWDDLDKGQKWEA